MNPRLAILLAALGATLAAVWWSEETETTTEIIPVARRHPAAAVPRQPAAAPADTRAKPAPRFPGGGPDLFPALSWRPPPAPVAAIAAPPPPPPMAPPLPFKYVGRWADEQGETVFLTLGEQVLSARAGQRLEPWRLDKVSADNLAFTYLPLDQQRQLRLTP